MRDYREQARLLYYLANGIYAAATDGATVGDAIAWLTSFNPRDIAEWCELLAACDPAEVGRVERADVEAAWALAMDWLEEDKKELDPIGDM